MRVFRLQQTTLARGRCICLTVSRFTSHRPWRSMEGRPWRCRWRRGNPHGDKRSVVSCHTRPHPEESGLFDDRKCPLTNLKRDLMFARKRAVGAAAQQGRGAAWVEIKEPVWDAWRVLFPRGMIWGSIPSVNELLQTVQISRVADLWTTLEEQIRESTVRMTQRASLGGLTLDVSL